MLNQKNSRPEKFPSFLDALISVGFPFSLGSRFTVVFPNFRFCYTYCQTCYSLLRAYVRKIYAQKLAYELS